MVDGRVKWRETPLLKERAISSKTPIEYERAFGKEIPTSR
jgi:hypothetical protein